MANPSSFDSNSNSPAKIIAIGAVAVVVVAAIAFYSIQNNKQADTAVVSTASPTPTDAATADTPVATPATQATASNYKNGSYTQTVTYRTPESTETIKVSLTLKNDIVTAVDETSSGTDRESQQYQNRFASSYKTQVLGKNIADLNLDTVSGASLTTGGFNEALQSIKSQASAA